MTHGAWPTRVVERSVNDRVPGLVISVTQRWLITDCWQRFCTLRSWLSAVEIDDANACGPAGCGSSKCPRPGGWKYCGCLYTESHSGYSTRFLMIKARIDIKGAIYYMVSLTRR